MSLPELDQRVPCPRCGTTEGLRIEISVPRQPGVTYAIACKCGVYTEPRESLRAALDLWDAGAELADFLASDTCAPREVVEDFLSKPFGKEVE